MDPVGGAASILQLISTVNDLWKFYQGISNAPTEIIKVRESLESLKDVLDHISKTFTTGNSISNPVFERTLKNIHEDMEAALKRLPQNGKSKSIKHRLYWTVGSKAATKEITKSIDRHKVSLMLLQEAMTRGQVERLIPLATTTIEQTSATQLDLVLSNFFSTQMASLQSMGILPTSTVQDSPMNDRFHFSSSKTLNPILEDKEFFTLRSSAGAISGAVAKYRVTTLDGDKEAYNIDIKIQMPRRFWYGQKALLLRYHEIQHKCMLPDPRSQLRTISIIPWSAPIWDALMNGDLNTTRSLILEKRASVFDQSDGWGLLHCAAAFGNIEVVDFLLSSGADPLQRTNAAESPLDMLHRVAPSALCKSTINNWKHQRFFPHCQITLIERYKLCCRSLERHSPDYTSSESFDGTGGFPVSNVLLTSLGSGFGVSISYPGEFDALSEWAEFLADRQVNIDGFHGYYYNPLMMFARSTRNKSQEKLALLLACGASAIVSDALGMTALHHVFDLVRSSNDSISIDGMSDEHMMMVALKATLILDRNLEIINTLINARDKLGRTPWDWAVMNGLKKPYRQALRKYHGISNVFEAENSPQEWFTWFDSPGGDITSITTNNPTSGNNYERVQPPSFSNSVVVQHISHNQDGEIFSLEWERTKYERKGQNPEESLEQSTMPQIPPSIINFTTFRTIASRWIAQHTLNRLKASFVFLQILLSYLMLATKFASNKALVYCLLWYRALERIVLVGVFWLWVCACVYVTGHFP